jgi:hypothetical protein
MSPCGELAGAGVVVGAWQMQWWAVPVAVGRWAPAGGIDRRWGGPTVALDVRAGAVGRTGDGEDEQGPSMAVADRWWGRRGGAPVDGGVVGHWRTAAWR